MQTIAIENRIEVLNSYVERGLLRVAFSEDGRLAQYNYTDSCVYEETWDEVTLNNRGHVYEVATGKLVARAFPKFFNLEQLDEETQNRYLKCDVYNTYEKLDGCLGVMYHYDGQWMFNSRGSFNSFASEAGKKILRDCPMTGLDKECSYLFEIVSPETRILINYNGESNLYLIGGYETQSGVELNGSALDLIARFNNFKQPKAYISTFEELLKIRETMDWTEEGFVIRLVTGERFKLKSFKYLELARIKANCNKHYLWKKMRDGEQYNAEQIKEMPDEFQKEVVNFICELNNEYTAVHKAITEGATELCKNLFNKTMAEVNEDVRAHAPIIKKFLEENEIPYKNFMFSAIKGFDLYSFIVRVIEPKEVVVDVL